MLSQAAFNAFLKTLEEPPQHAIFILATTEKHKIIPTILSRCQIYDFNRIRVEDAVEYLRYIAGNEGVTADDESLNLIAQKADGGMRDGLSLLDQCASATTGDLTAERVYACLGIAGIQECGKLMGYIAQHDTGKALGLFNRFYSEGKDIGALMDELACLTRDLMVMKTAPGAGITMLSGVASDQEVLELTRALSSSELVRMMNLLQTTLSGFTRSASRRMDAELCLLEMCRPELNLDAKALNARLTRLEEQIKSGAIVAAASQKKAKQEVPEDLYDDDRPPMPGDEDAPPAEEEPCPAAPTPSEAPAGFWPELCGAVRKELRPPVTGFFAPSPNAPVQGALIGNTLELRCGNDFIAKTLDKPEILEVVSRKVSAMLGRPARAVVVDMTAKPAGNPRMEQLMKFGRDHSDIIKIKK